MPMPVYFIVGEREVSLTDDEARKLAERLPRARLRDHVEMRIGENNSTPVRMDVGGDEQANVVAVRDAIASMDDEDLTPALKSLRRAVLTVLGEE
jgi:hypothetical protein